MRVGVVGGVLGRGVDLDGEVLAGVEVLEQDGEAAFGREREVAQEPAAVGRDEVGEGLAFEWAVGDDGAFGGAAATRGAGLGKVGQLPALADALVGGVAGGGQVTAIAAPPQTLCL